MISEGVMTMVDRVLNALTERIDEIREQLRCIDGDAARQMEQEMDRLQQIVDSFRGTNDDHA